MDGAAGRARPGVLPPADASGPRGAVAAARLDRVWCGRQSRGFAADQVARSGLRTLCQARWQEEALQPPEEAARRRPHEESTHAAALADDALARWDRSALVLANRRHR